jgi:hypothetical protein
VRRRGLICIAATAAAAAALAAPGAFAASSQQIYKDYADNGRIDGQYSRADLQRALRNVQVHAYGKATMSAGLPAAIQKALGAQPTRGLSGSGSGPTGGLPFSSPTGGLPFTGFDLTLMLLGGLGLLTLGVGLRMLGRSKL